MMGRTHALTGIATGLIAAPAAQVDSTAGTLLFAVITAGWSVVPDLDHPDAAPSKALGVFTRLLAFVVRAATWLIYTLTRTSLDGEGTHRTVTHTGLFGVGSGAAIGVAAAETPWVAVAAAAFGAVLVADRLGGWTIAVAIGAAAALWSSPGGAPSGHAVMADVSAMGWTVGVAATVGCLTHVLGDMLTNQGVPLAFPLSIDGQRYFGVGPPRALRFSTDGAVEHWLIVPIFLALDVLIGSAVLGIAVPPPATASPAVNSVGQAMPNQGCWPDHPHVTVQAGSSIPSEQHDSRVSGPPQRTGCEHDRVMPR